MTDLTNEQMTAIFGADEAPAVTPAPEVAAAAPVENTQPLADPDLDRARAALVRDGWSDEDLSAYKADRIKAIGLKRHENQEKVTTDYRELHSYRDSQKAKAAETKPAGSDSAPAPLADFAALQKSFEVEHGPEAAKALVDALQPMAKTVESLRQQADAATRASEAREFKRLQEVASGVYPPAKDESVAQAVMAVARTVLQADPTLSDDAAVLKACERFGVAPVKSALLPNVAQTRVQPKHVEATREEKELQLMELIERGGKSVDELRKVFTG